MFKLGRCNKGLQKELTNSGEKSRTRPQRMLRLANFAVKQIAQSCP
jgi:hypothetical protein